MNPSDFLSKSKLHLKIVGDLHSMIDGCEKGGFKNLKEYIKGVLEDLDTQPLVYGK